MNQTDTLQRLACSLREIIDSLPSMGRHRSSNTNEPTQVGDDTSGDAQPMEFRASGMFTVVALYAILVLLALHLNAYGIMWHAIVSTFAGSNTQARVIDHTLRGLIGAIAATATLAVPLAFASGAIGNLIYGKPKSHGALKLFNGIKAHYFMITATVTAEELVARFLFLGIPLWIGHQHLATWAFWILFLAGNAGWAAVHMSNFKDPKERHLLRTLPQFVGGVFFTVAFINFGLFGALMVHLAYNNLLFSAMRKGIFNRGELVAIMWHGCIATISGLFLYGSGKSLFDMAYWLNMGNNGASYRIPGWSTSDYIWGALMVTSLLYVIADLMLFDLYRGDDRKPVYDNLIQAGSIIAFAYGAFLGLRVLHTPFEMRVAVMAVIFMAIARTASGSGMARVFWIGIPWLMTLIYTTLALGLASPIWVILLAVAFIEAVDDVIRIKDRHREEATVRPPAVVVPSSTE